MPMLDNLLAFSDFLRRYREVEREVWVKNSDRKENDAEHSFSLAMLAFYIISTHKLPLDLGKVLLYALAHDLVEVYAGDTPIHDKDQSLHDSKHERERLATERIKAEFPELPELHTAIANYEAKVDPEAKFVYALDKIEPTMAIYLDKGRIWKHHGITYQMVEDIKRKKVIENAIIEKYRDDLLERIKIEQADLF